MPLYPDIYRHLSRVTRLIGVSMAVGWLLLCSLSQAAPSQIQVLGLFTNAALINIDGKQRMLKAGKVSPEGVKLISANSKEAVVEIEGERLTLGLSQNISTRFQKPENASIKISINDRGQYIASGTINGQLVQLLVDTGANLLAMNSKQARSLGIDFRLQGTPTQVSTASGIASAYSVNLDSVQVGPLALTNIQAVIIEGNFPRQILLGMSFLGQVSIFEEDGILELKQKF